jgi:signal transduction histidine kinase
MKAYASRESPTVDAREEVLAIVAHELRHPLAAIASWTELLKHHELTEAQRGRALEIIARSAAAQRRILDDLFDHACIAHRKLHLQRTTVNVAELAIATAEAMSAIAAERCVHVEWTTPSPPAPVHGDADRLTQVFCNLIANAIGHSPSGSRIAVEVERLGGHVLVRIRDSGVGIAPHLLPHVFEPFRRGQHSAVARLSRCTTASCLPRAREKGSERRSRFGCPAQANLRKTGLAIVNRHSQCKTHGFVGIGA